MKKIAAAMSKFFLGLVSMVEPIQIEGCGSWGDLFIFISAATY